MEVLLPIVLFLILTMSVVMAGSVEGTKEGSFTRVYYYLFVEPEGGYFSATVKVYNKGNADLVSGIVKFRWLECTKEDYLTKGPYFLPPAPDETGLYACINAREHSIVWAEMEVTSRYSIGLIFFTDFMFTEGAPNDFGCTW